MEKRVAVGRLPKVIPYDALKKLGKKITSQLGTVGHVTWFPDLESPSLICTLGFDSFQKYQNTRYMNKRLYSVSAVPTKDN